MKKLFLIIVLAVLGITAKAQAVSDMAVIPIGVTLNSIARLTVTSGGNIEFVVNTMDQYETGIVATPATTTTFSVACSNKFGVTVQSDVEKMKGTINSSNEMASQFISFEGYDGTGKSATVNTTETPLTTKAVYVVGTESSLQNAGTYAGFQIKWSLKPSVSGTSGNTKLTDLPSDRYVINAFLQLVQGNNVRNPY